MPSIPTRPASPTRPTTRPRPRPTPPTRPSIPTRPGRPGASPGARPSRRRTPSPVRSLYVPTLPDPLPPNDARAALLAATQRVGTALAVALNPVQLSASKNRVIRADLAVGWSCYMANLIAIRLADFLTLRQAGQTEPPSAEAIERHLEDLVQFAAGELNRIRFHYMQEKPSWPRRPRVGLTRQGRTEPANIAAVGPVSRPRRNS